MYLLTVHVFALVPGRIWWYGAQGLAQDRCYGGASAEAGLPDEELASKSYTGYTHRQRCPKNEPSTSKVLHALACDLQCAFNPLHP